MPERTADIFTRISRGDRILYNEKQQPLTVTAVREDAVEVDGPQGGEYLLFRAPDDPETILESQSGNREYSRQVTDLRITGEWQQTADDQWEHTVTGATVRLDETGAGYWTVVIEGFSGETPDIPAYGFTEKSIARETAGDFMDAHPEGKQ
jgi:hypothetical protein